MASGVMKEEDAFTVAVSYTHLDVYKRQVGRYIKMKLTILGTGNAKVTKCYNTCFVLNKDKEYFMIDGGTSV